MKKLLLSFSLILSFLSVFAQSNEVEMADALRSNGRIYIVVICIVIILLGLLIYLFSIDRRIKMLEKKSEGKN